MEHHNLGGNCEVSVVTNECRRCGTDNLCDVCHLHDEPRGDCDKCQRCEACEEVFSRELN